MAYSAPFIGPAGLSIPSFQDILDLYVSQFKAIYGQTIDLDNSSPDFQLMSVIALAAADAAQAVQLDYNNRSPATAIGAALDTLVKDNGLTRKAASASTCTVTLSGVVGSVVINGQVRDINGILWNLPASVTIGGGGTVDATATCTVLGAINALVGQITGIATPTAGWTSVTNATPATLGQAVESDAQLRARQAVSVELPSITILAGTIAAIAAVPGVSRYNVLENNTGATDAFGNPPHSVTAVVEGGTNLDVATAIFNNRGIGPDTNGTVTVPVTDPNSGITMNIHFDRPTSVPIFVIANVHLGPGGTTATLTAVKTALVAYLNGLQIGEVVTYGSLVAAAMSVNPNPLVPIAWVRSLFFARTATPTTITDVALLFTEVAQGVTADITVNSV
jgi:uncharacterized phage protein gp47/JayE